MLVELIWYLKILKRGYCFDRYIGSKECKNHYLDQQFCWAFDRYAVGEVWDNKRGLGSTTKVIHTIKFYKTISIGEWYTSSSSEEYEYSRVLLCYDRSLGLIGSYIIDRIKGI